MNGALGEEAGETAEQSAEAASRSEETPCSAEGRGNGATIGKGGCGRVDTLVDVGVVVAGKGFGGDGFVDWGLLILDNGEDRYKLLESVVELDDDCMSTCPF